VNDEKFSKYLVTGKLLLKPLGKRALLQELSSKGVSDSLATQAVEQAYAGADELEMAKTAALSRLPRLRGLKKEALQRRLFGFLSRRGFSPETIYKVVREVTHPSAGSG
jgi:regulatory protein